MSDADCGAALTVVPTSSVTPQITTATPVVYVTETVEPPDPGEGSSRNALFRRSPPPPPRRRQSSRPPPKVRPRGRNAAAVAALPPARVAKGDVKPRASSKADEAPVKSGVERLEDMGYVVLASSLASVGGALAARWGFHPGWVTGGLTAVGAFGGWRAKGEVSRQVYTGIASVGLSQIALMMLQKASEPPKQVADASKPDASKPSPVAQRPRAADLSSMPPGVLDAAFERARAELALERDGHNDYKYNGPVHIPFVP